MALEPGPHQAFENAWNAWFREIGATGQRCNRQLVTLQGLLTAAATIYKANPEIVQELDCKYI
jgi:hypothetical protein